MLCVLHNAMKLVVGRVKTHGEHLAERVLIMRICEFPSPFSGQRFHSLFLRTIARLACHP
jgi:hypothetical protein